MINSRLAAVVITMATVVSLAGCSSSSGGSGVTQSQLEAKLKTDPTIQALTKSGGQKAAAVDKFLACASKALIRDANSAELKEYVEGKISMSKVKPKSSSAKDDAKSAETVCAKSALKPTG